MLQEMVRNIQNNENAIQRKEMLTEEIVKMAEKDYAYISAVTAIGGLLHVDAQHKALGNRQLTIEEITKIGKGMDHATIPIAEKLFHKSRLRNVIIASEGEKDDAPFLKGEFGPLDGPRKEVIHDAIDGTSLIAARQENAISLISGSDKFEKIPSKDLYMVSITGPAEAKKAIFLSLNKTGHKQTLLNICEELGIVPEELTQVVLNPNKKGREINNVFLEAGNELKVKNKIINAGDFMPRIFCSLSPEERFSYCERYDLDRKEFGGYMIMVGRGGTPELSAASAAGKITGAPTLAYPWNSDINNIDTQNIFNTDRLVPGDKDSTIVVASFATANSWLRQPGVQINPDGSYVTRTMTLTTQNGLEVATNTFSPKDLA
jgi:fructose-1,6-bisphosphatase/sedoheptulose 1,7-bisphosphatase-like protein